MIPDRVRAALAALDRPVCAYVYDRAVLRATAAAVRAALPAGSLLLYAVKANGHPDVVAALASTVDGLEVASGGELSLAAAAGAATIAFGGPAKTPAELTAAVAAGASRRILVNVESPLELRRLSTVDGLTTVLLRVNRSGAGLPGTHHMTGVATQFGIDEAQLPDAVALARSLPGIRLAGFHLHAVSNNLDAAAHAGYVAGAVHWSAEAADRFGIGLEYVNVGGGFGVDYTGDVSFDLDALRDGLAAVRVPDGARLVFEPGRYLVAAGGWYAAEVLDLKHTHGRTFAVLRGGTHHFRLPAAWGYSHPAIVVPVDDWPYPYDRPEVRKSTVDIVGELCTPRDVLARDTAVDRLRVGDLLVFGNAGGYGWDISHHDFLRHPYPAVVVL